MATASSGVAELGAAATPSAKNGGVASWLEPHDYGRMIRELIDPIGSPAV